MFICVHLWLINHHLTPSSCSIDRVANFSLSKNTQLLICRYRGEFINIAMSNEQLTMNTSATRSLPFDDPLGPRSRSAVQAIKSSCRKMPLSLYTKVMQPMQHFCIKNVACNDTSAKRYRLTINYPLSTIHYQL